MGKYVTILRRKRLQTVPFTAQRMQFIGEQVLGSIHDRISHATDVFDLPAPPLSIRYAEFKGRRYPPAIRNLHMTGATLSHLKVKSAAPNTARLGFLDGVRTFYSSKKGGERVKHTIRILDLIRMNQRRSMQWGTSPRDKVALLNAIHNEPFVRVADVA
jgi:hypothetical protein